MWGLVKTLGGGFKKKNHQKKCTCLDHRFKSAFNRIYFWFRSMLYFSFIPLVAHVKKNRHKYQENVTPSLGLKARRKPSKGQESCRPAHRPHCPKGRCMVIPCSGPSPYRSGRQTVILPWWEGHKAQTWPVLTGLVLKWDVFSLLQLLRLLYGN